MNSGIDINIDVVYIYVYSIEAYCTGLDRYRYMIYGCFQNLGGSFKRGLALLERALELMQGRLRADAFKSYVAVSMS